MKQAEIENLRIHDIRRTLGAVWGEITGGSDYGGSTLTQQLVKNITGDREHSRGRKVREIFRAMEVEKKLTKSVRRNRKNKY